MPYRDIDVRSLDACVREIVAREWEPAEAAALRVVRARRGSFVRIVDLGERATRTLELSDTRGLCWPWHAGRHSVDAHEALPARLRDLALAKTSDWTRQGSPARMDVATDVVVECALSRRSERLFVALRAGVVVGYRHRFIGSRRIASALALLLVAILAPTLGGVGFGFPGFTAGAVVTVLIAVALVTHFGGKDNGGAAAWAKVR